MIRVNERPGKGLRGPRKRRFKIPCAGRHPETSDLEEELEQDTAYEEAFTAKASKYKHDNKMDTGSQARPKARFQARKPTLRRKEDSLARPRLDRSMDPGLTAYGRSGRLRRLFR